MNPYRLYFGLIEVFFIFYKHSRLVEKILVVGRKKLFSYRRKKGWR